MTHSPERRDPAPHSQVPHSHVFLGAHHARNERRTWLVIVITAVMMVAEIVAGSLYGSMALIADGWHMSTHAGAMLISALAYRYARRHADDPRFTFGTGRVGELAGFASAVVLALIALVIAWESFLRLTSPVPIAFREAIGVAVIGLGVNLLCAWLLGGTHDHHHGHEHGHGHDHDRHAKEHHAHEHHVHEHHAHDSNIRAAYLHVLADALTSILAIAALAAGSVYGWLWLDPTIGIVGALVIARWSWGLIRDAGGVLVDFVPEEEELPGEIRAAIEGNGETITDLHVWQVGPGHHAAIVAVASPEPQSPDAYRARLAHLRELAHVTVEVSRAA